MKRRLISILPLLSLVLCVATCALWVRSTEIRDIITYNFASGTQLSMGTDPHRIRLQIVAHEREYLFGGNYAVLTNPFFLGWHSESFRIVKIQGFYSYQYSYPHNDDGWGIAGFYYENPTFALHPPYQFLGRSTRIVIPFWFIAIACAAGFVQPLIRGVRARRRRASGNCLQCGYDLRATPGRCPECGTIP